MSYKITTKSDKIEVDLTKNSLVTTLARTGGQGSKGDSITHAYINSNNELIIEVTASDGSISTLNAGTLSVSELYSLTELNDVTVTAIQNDEVLMYNDSTEQFENHRLTTSKLADIDNTNKTDGALLVYSGSTQKYTATNQLNNPNTLIVGGTF